MSREVWSGCTSKVTPPPWYGGGGRVDAKPVVQDEVHMMGCRAVGGL